MRKKKVNGKLITAMLSLILLFSGTLGNSLAWLLATSGSVTNEFTKSKLEIALDEAQNIYQMVPGCSIAKNPYVTVDQGSEDCYVFVVVEEKNNQLKSDPHLKYYQWEIDKSIWTQLKNNKEEDIPGVFYTKVMGLKNASAPRILNVLGGGTYSFSGVTYAWQAENVLTSPEVTKSDMIYAASTPPKLIFTAYATQLIKGNTGVNGALENFTPFEAWQIANK